MYSSLPYSLSDVIGENLATSNGPFAHTLPEKDPSHWEPLQKHLDLVADLAGRNASSFGAKTWGEVLGRCHDLGKLSAEFQQYLRSRGDGSDDAAQEDARQAVTNRVDHSTFGARFVAYAYPGVLGQLLAHCIAGHHGGLPDEHPLGIEGGTLRHRLDPAIYSIPDVDAPAILTPTLKLPLRPASRQDVPFQLAFFTRMLFSCLIDADRTCTEAFCNPELAAERASHAARQSLEALQVELNRNLTRMAAEAEQTTVNGQRAEVLAHCRMARDLAPGFFSLNVPTGGGKTLSSLAFALGHAIEHEMSRIIVAIPYTSIIEQTADVYRGALGPLADSGVVEHHTSLQPTRDTRANQMGAENWEAPLIVTTNVQLLESLFACRTTPCRKLHNVARSVIVLDEAQSIPVEYLKPILAALRELVLNYGCSIVLCTATQPALERRADFELGLENVRPIIPNALRLFQTLRRVEVKNLGKVADDDLVKLIAAEESALCIVNTRKHAARLYKRLSAQEGVGTCFHLSTWMCGAHRRRVLADVRKRLRSGLTCKLVSTQLVEAGVDVDFPAVYRAETGFDSIAQAAGRCNREGRRPIGYTYVFEAEEPPPAGLLRAGAATARELRHLHPDQLTPAAVEAYFRLHYWTQKGLWDKWKVMDAVEFDSQRGRALLQFREVAKRFVLIRESTLPLLVPFGEGKALWDKLSLHKDHFVLHRALQPYLVSVPQRAMQELLGQGLVAEHESGVYLLQNRSVYDEHMGLDLKSSALDESFWYV